MKKILSVSFVCLGLFSCSSESPNDALLQESNPTESTGETPAAVTWKLCAPDETFPGSTTATNTDSEGCRHNQDKAISVWPLEDGRVEVVYVRTRLGALGNSPTTEYSLTTISRGCDPNGPGEVAYYRTGETVAIDRAWANDRGLIAVEDVTVTPLDEAIANESTGMVLFDGGNCGVVDPVWLGDEAVLPAN